MPNVQFSMNFREVAAADVFARAADFERYAEIAESVREVRISEAGDGRLNSHWEVNFRRGVLRWSECDLVDHDNRTIEFAQLTGDLAEFHGMWSVIETEQGVQIRFDAFYDLGMPTLAELLDPVAERALRDNVAELMAGFAAAAGGVRADTAESTTAA